MKSITLRSATAEDAAFAFRCEAETMRQYAVETWGEWPEEKVRAKVLENATAGRTEIIELEGEPIGVLRVERGPAGYDLQQIFLMPRHQRAGIGSALLRELMREATRAGVPLGLRVLKVNPARNLYRRLGFALVRSTPEHEYFEIAPRVDG